MGVATAVAIGGLAVSAASTTMSFVQAGQQKKKQREAEAKAAEAMAEARKKLEVNYAEELAIQKEPYELEREAMLAQGALAMQAGVESDRGAETTAGKLQMAQNQAQAGIRSAMGQELQGIQEKIINEESRLRDVGVQLDLGEVEGAQLAARDAEEARAQAMSEGFQGVASTLQQGLAMVPLFQQNTAAQKAAVGNMNMSTEEFQKIGNVQGKKGGISKSMGAAGTGPFTNLDFEKVKGMSNREFRQFKRELSPLQQQMLFQNPQYTQNYNPFDIYK
jgi:hypothetical protein